MTWHSHNTLKSHHYKITPPTHPLHRSPFHPSSSSMAPSLIGPPSIQTPPSKPSGHPFVDLMVTTYNSHTTHSNNPSPTPPPPLMGFTKNLSATYLSTGNPCLDLFFHVVPDTPSDSLKQRLSIAWAHDPLTTLKLICNLRGVRGTGKSDKNGFYTAAFWLHTHHPKTLACNLPSFAEFGYFKDFPEILFQVLGMTRPGKMRKQRRFGGIGFGRGRRSSMKRRGGQRSRGNPIHLKSKDERIREAVFKQMKEKEKASEIRHEKKAELAKIALERYNRDPDYRFLHDRVSDLFSGFLRSDLEAVKSDKLNKISLAAKWCPSLDSSFDRATLLCEAIARKVFPKEEFSEYVSVEEAHYAYRVRDRLRKDVLTPLRKALELPEVFMGANRWEELPYNRVASVAMKTYKDLFVKHDGERFQEYLDKVKSGEAKIAAGALLPHQIIASLFGGDDGGEVAELQWKRMVEDMSKVGKLTNCIAVCDVSGSMEGTPMEVCVALGLLLSELSDEPWKGKVITFSSNPQLHLIQGDTLKSKTKFIRGMEWGMNTDFQKVFDQILNVAVKGGLTGNKMVKTVFVFSDMEFDQASTNPWETDYMVIKRKYEEKGYGDNVPEIVFWNLRDSKATPVPQDQKGVALVSGFSKNMMKLFMEGKDMQLDPELVMEAAIAGDEYGKLVVLD